MSEAPQDVRDLAMERAARRAAKDFSAADELRDRIARGGWSVVDEPGGWRLEPIEASTADASHPRSLRPHDVGSVLDEPATADVSMHWVVEGWPQDVRRAIESFRANAGGRDVQYVVADVTGEPDDSWGQGVEVVPLEGGTGWGAACNAGLNRSRGRVVLAMDGSVEATGDVLGPLESALGDPTIGVCGPFGIVTPDLREFDATDGPEADAIEGYCMAFRREILTTAGLFDEKFRWYRTADIEYSFRIKDLGLRAVVVPVPVERHEHRMWFQTPPAERAKWSKRNFYRFLDRWRDRYDLTVSGEPSPHDHSHGHADHEHGP
ncbi:MAG: glycosyltransferase family 2 protein [Actinomycetota bacterium]